MNQVLVENQAKANEVHVAENLISKANDLAREHEEFNNKYIVSGRKALYELLGKIYFLAEELDGCIDRKEQVSLLKSVLSEKYGIRTQENTSDTAVLVRYVTQADRKTAHVYARAIEAARFNKIDSSKFVGYVEQAGGIEKIRADSAAPVLSYQDIEAIENDKDMRLELYRKYITARIEFPLASFKLGKKYVPQLQRASQFKKFICYERDGRYYVLAEQEGEVNPKRDLVRLISEKLSPDLSSSSKSINSFYKKAMIKRKHRTIKLIGKKRPEMARAMLIRMRKNHE
jgi:hypothetical protein